MRELEYPFDSQYIIGKKLKLRKQLLNDGTPRMQVKIAILGGFTTYDIKLCIELFLLNYNIAPVFYESEYNLYFQEAVFPSKEFIEFHPDLIYLCTSYRNISMFPEITDSKEKVDKLLSSEINKYIQVWNNLKKEFNCPIIQNNFEKPIFRLLGNREAYDIHGQINYITRLNQCVYEYAQSHDNLFICDLDYISSDYGLSKWHDLQNWYMYKYPMALDAIPMVSFNVSNIIKSIYGKNKKSYVLDLDETLWGGVIGDIGAGNIELGPESAIGQAYLEFQDYIKKHKQLGVLLNVCSKNEYQNAIDGLKHNNAILREEDMVIIQANWDRKDINLNKIAQRLSLLYDAFVFVDDNPAERELIENNCHNVAAPNIGSVEDYIKILDHSGFFESTVLTRDDTKRDEMYKANILRLESESQYEDYHEYLISLEMVATIREFDKQDIPRILQLINKSNQFNLTTRRYTLDEIEQISNSCEYITLYGRLEDKYGDNGVVSVAVGHRNGDEIEIVVWVMSCRVLKRDFEYAMMDQFVTACKQKGIESIKGLYYPTSKNSMVKDFYGLNGFKKTNEEPDGTTTWVLAVENYSTKNDIIKLKNDENE